MNEKPWIFWLAVILSIIGVIAIVVMALNAAGVL
jgi:hypothetical protein